MGVCYILADDASAEAYDLGKGLWGEWDEHIPASQEEVLKLLSLSFPDDLLEGIGRCPEEGRTRMMEGIWSFLESHPRARVRNDFSGDYILASSREELAQEKAYYVAQGWTEEEGYVVVGSLWEDAQKP